MNKHQKNKLLKTTTYLSKWYGMFFRVEKKDKTFYLIGRDDGCNHSFIATIGNRGGIKVVSKLNVNFYI